MTWLSKIGLLARLKKGKTKPKVVGKSITSPILGQTKIRTANTIEKSQASNKAVDTSKSNKTDTVKSIDK